MLPPMRIACRLALALVVVLVLACGGSHTDPPAGRVAFFPPALLVTAGSNAQARACYHFEGAGDPGITIELPDGKPDGVNVVGTTSVSYPCSTVLADQLPKGIQVIVAATADAVPGTFAVRVRLSNADAAATKDLPVTVVRP